jgi:hypothetical protein
MARLSTSFYNIAFTKNLKFLYSSHVYFNPTCIYTNSHWFCVIFVYKHFSVEKTVIFSDVQVYQNKENYTLYIKLNCRRHFYVKF